MKALSLLAWISCVSPAFSSTVSDGHKGSLIVDAAPNFLRPYILPKYKGSSVYLHPPKVHPDVIRFSITSNSSGGAFGLIQHTGRDSGWTAARSHSHRLTHEYLYCFKGRVQLWAQAESINSSQEARVATPGDFGSVPPGTIHNFQLTDPSAHMTHIFHPGGFEHLFDIFSYGPYNSSVDSPYPPEDLDGNPFGPVTPAIDAELRGLDLYVDDAFVPRRDFVNGTAGDPSQRWHSGSNTLPTDAATPYFIAKDFGPMYLNSEAGYQVIQPLVTPMQATGGNFTMGTIIMSPKLANETVFAATLPHTFALQVDEGQLVLSLSGYETAYLLPGDVALIPAGIRFSYYTTIPATKFIYMNAGAYGLDYQLLRKSTLWGFPAYPINAGFRS